jgi:hypothetical protein
VVVELHVEWASGNYSVGLEVATETRSESGVLDRIWQHHTTHHD